MSPATPDTGPVRRIVGVYNADGTAIGELRYFFGARFGRTHCALCDVTHGLVRAKHEWAALRDELPVPFDTFHRNDQPDALWLIPEPLPFVVAETEDGYVMLLGAADLERCEGSVHRLHDAVLRAIAQARLHLPARKP